MSFYIYHKSAQFGAVQFDREASIQFTGTSGLFARHLQQHTQEETPFSWMLSESETLKLCGISSGNQQHCILVDLIPEALVQVCLYRLHSIRGVSHYDETDLALCLIPHYEGMAQGGADEFRRSFTLSKPPRDQQMLEAMSLSGGLHAGKYRWAPPKMNLGAAVRSAGA